MSDLITPSNSKDPHLLSSYDSVFVILKPSAEVHEAYTGIIKFDKNKKKYFLSGKIIMEEKPKYNTLSFVSEKNIPAYKKSKKKIEKEKYIVNIIFGHIDYITLQFDSLDWIK